LTEYCEGGDLETLVKKRILEKNPFSEQVFFVILFWTYMVTNQEVLKVILDVMNGLKVLHSNNVVHCDVKTANILIGSGRTYKLSLHLFCFIFLSIQMTCTLPKYLVCQKKK
jgi:serine/threonine protein kinase